MRLCKTLFIPSESVADWKMGVGPILPAESLAAFLGVNGVIKFLSKWCHEQQRQRQLSLGVIKKDKT